MSSGYLDHSIIKHQRDSLKNCSMDTKNDEFMTESELQVVNFDKVKSLYIADLGLQDSKAHSVDAFVKGKNGSFYFIEFKNGDISGIKNEIHLKIRDSLLLICDICKKEISDTRKDITFVFVYNEEKANFSRQDKIAIAKANSSGHVCSWWDLDKIQDVFVKNVLIYDREQLNKKLLPDLISI